KLLQRQGLSVGIVSRGYGGRDIAQPQWVLPDSSPLAVGDEAVMLSRRCECPVVVCTDRVAAANALLERQVVDVLLSDDGLQHYALRRDIEIAVVDAERGLGNGWLMPAGPLREPSWRLDTVDFVVRNGDPSGFLLEPTGLHALTGAQRQDLGVFRDQRVHAVAGIGHPQRFFSALRQRGMEVIEHAFADHHQFSRKDFNFSGDLPILMTEKDAVKCSALGLSNAWYVPVDALLAREWSEAFSRLVVEQVAGYFAESRESEDQA
ncbi:MAG: tetraacyldisaccharide 4'-kinase, partial [Granulosicoccaceae bacterium]